jgi:(p)ppGpp synthase/HD superfamily hydrolase
MTQLGQAIALAAEVHEHQVDKAGVTYILHPLAVMERARDFYLARSDGFMLEEVMIVAVLHDALEDLDEKNPYDYGRLRAQIHTRFGLEVSVAVDAITKLPKPMVETYDDYLTRVEGNWMARIAKIADLSHNMDAFRLPSGQIGERDFKRWDKYHRALVRLMKSEVHAPA